MFNSSRQLATSGITASEALGFQFQSHKCQRVVFFRCPALTYNRELHDAHIYVGLVRVFSCPFSMETTTHGVLELLLVSAVGLKHAHHHLGPQRYYVTIHCGDQLRASKITRGKHRRIWWNEKFRFPLSPRECRELAKVTLKIMERDKFAEDTLVGEIRVHVGEIIRESSEREFLQMKPAPYNIVLRDGTYKGELKLGLKFLSGVSSEQPGERQQCAGAPPRRPYVVYTPFLNITLPCVPWRRFFFLCTRSNRWTTKE